MQTTGVSAAAKEQARYMRYKLRSIESSRVREFELSLTRWAFLVLTRRQRLVVTGAVDVVREVMPCLGRLLPPTPRLVLRRWPRIC